MLLLVRFVYFKKNKGFLDLDIFKKVLKNLICEYKYNLY